MDKDTRNTLRNTVTSARRKLERAVTDVLEGRFGIYATGEVEDERRMSHLTDEELEQRRVILAHLEHILSAGLKPKPAVEQLIREIAFTHLNRLVAFKLMEQRGLIREAVSRGAKSPGVEFYLVDHPDDADLYDTGDQETAYRNFLTWQAQQFADEITVLFSPSDPANIVYPSLLVLNEVLDLINSEELAGIWTEDETIGWVYQYFTPKELRDQARSESSAPRNSYELAFRNQFYTPRYVVEFLTDNTLGRTWYEMLQGDTVITEHCDYLVRRPNEVFLAEGEEVPEQEDTAHLSQEELLQQPAYIPYRPVKDPRSLRVLDPACGSGHFLLYAFDLLAEIYEEAWERDLQDEVTGRGSLRNDYETLDALRRDIPRNVLRYNLYGIDIDRRATQIAALALWLRAQRYYNDHDMGRESRPRITQGNIVVAEPMPGNRDLLDEFAATLNPPLLGQLVKRVFGKMQLAGEAGSLLKIEEAIQEDIAEAKRLWEREPEPEQLELFPGIREPQARQLEIFDVSQIDDVQFWQQVEKQVTKALRDYAEQASNGKGVQRQLFAEDAAGGFAFIEVLQKRYDVVLMNPPFGANTKNANSYVSDSFPNSKQDIAYAFVDRFINHLRPLGSVGAITTRTGFFIQTSEDWRREVLNRGNAMIACADLGYGVLDAVVETAAYVVSKDKTVTMSVFINLLEDIDKGEALNKIVWNGSKVYEVDATAFEGLPGAPFGYWAPSSLLNSFAKSVSFEPVYGEVKRGVATGDNERWLRLFWEISPWQIGKKRKWIRYANGGEYSPYYIEMQLLIEWENDGYGLKHFVDENGRQRSRPQNTDYFYRPGLTYSTRTTSGFAVRALPGDSGFDQSANPIFVKNSVLDKSSALAYFMSRPVQAFIELSVGSGDTSQSGTAARNYTNGLVGRVPIPFLAEETLRHLSSIGLTLAREKRKLIMANELAPEFAIPACLVDRAVNLHRSIVNYVNIEIEVLAEMLELSYEADNASIEAFGLDTSAVNFLDDFIGIHPLSYGLVNDPNGNNSNPSRVTTKKCYWADRDLEIRAHELQLSPKSILQDQRFIQKRVEKRISDDAELLISYAIGIVLGRWDVRYATGETDFPVYPDPFEALPICPPGMLQNDDGLPATSHPEDYPAEICWDGILVDDAEHPDDIVNRIRDVLHLLWSDHAYNIEQEILDFLGEKSLRSYLGKSGNSGFFIKHVQRYSGSRRKAPIYWYLQSNSKNYGLWLYYHRLDSDLLYKALTNYVRPKVQQVQHRMEDLRARASEDKSVQAEFEEMEDFYLELVDFRDKLQRAADLNLQPDLNDGVVLNIAPLYELVPWKEAEKYWKRLLKGEYEWSSIGQQLRERGLVKQK